MNADVHTALEGDRGSAVSVDRRSPGTLDEQLMTTAGVARMLNVSRATAARWAREGQVESWRVGSRGHHRIPRSQFDVDTMARLLMPRRFRDFFRDADDLERRLEKTS